MRRAVLLIVAVGCAGRTEPKSVGQSGPECSGMPTAGPSTSDSGADDDPDDPAEVQVLSNVRLPGSEVPTSIQVHGSTIVAVGPDVDPTGATFTDGGGRYVVPGVIDSHVHLAYLPEAEALAAAGVVAAVDLAAPLTWLADPPTDLRIAASGPMITAESGYPTTSWGRHGYGVECPDEASAVAAVDALVAAGAQVIKVPLSAGPDLSRATLVAIAQRADALDVPLAIHALTDGGAALGADVGGDLLVHVPTERLRDATVAAWADRTVVPTLTAFGNSAAARDNLARLIDAGADVLYGTDFGNSRALGISDAELQAMADAGMSPAAVLEAATSAPARFWGWDDLGRVDEGAHGVVVLLDADPTTDVSTWSRSPERWPSTR